jgi:hypothetical protein
MVLHIFKMHALIAGVTENAGYDWFTLGSMNLFLVREKEIGIIIL